jgi:two-component system chemotaxis response regulator CheY
VSGRAYIVCVDDEQAVLNQLSAQLTRRFGDTHLVECAESAEEALRLIAEVFGAGDVVELLICDQVMPGMKGDRFLEAVHNSHPEVMKVLLTGQAGLDSAIYAINRAGLHRYVEKPWEAEDLNMAIHNLLTQHRLARELKEQHERLERKNRELRGLHDLGRRLASTVDPEAALPIALEAARSLSGAAVAAAVVVAEAGRPPRWEGLPAAPLDDQARREIEASLARLRAEGRVSGPHRCPPDLSALPLHHSDVLFGWIFLGGARPMEDDADLLSVLAGQVAASLNAARLLKERLASERLSTIGRMISALVHDLRNPMTAIKGYAGMFEQFDLSSERQKECARLIIEESDRMSAMIDETLEFSRGEKIRLHLSAVSVLDLAKSVGRLVEPAFSAKRLSFRTELTYGGQILVDVDRMKRAILNIASNAADAMEPGGVFTMSSALVADSVEISLADTGHGIPPELQSQVFEPFFTHGKARGIGLGMAITRKIVEEHGGRIRLESQPGRGTRFIVSLPAERRVLLESPTAGGRVLGDR